MVRLFDVLGILWIASVAEMALKLMSILGVWAQRFLRAANRMALDTKEDKPELLPTKGDDKVSEACTQGAREPDGDAHEQDQANPDESEKKQYEYEAVMLHLYVRRTTKEKTNVRIYHCKASCSNLKGAQSVVVPYPPPEDLQLCKKCCQVRFPAHPCFTK